MEKIISVSGVESSPEKAGFSSKKLPLAEMEYELDNCPAPWRCNEVCYGACVGCTKTNEGR